jgi:uncharacterized C2H2 Zn-finger protein
MEGGATTTTTTQQTTPVDGAKLKCPDCDAMFPKANKLKRHVLNVHQDVVSLLPF